MPELPEVETIARDLALVLPGRGIRRVQVIAPLVAKTPLQTAEGAVIAGVRRFGKSILIVCDAGVLAIGLGMTGRLLLHTLPSRYTRVHFALSTGAICYDDIRQFGRVSWTPAIPRHLLLLGPDPLEISLDEFLIRLKRFRSRIKPLLLNQRFLRGIGNIYADEILFDAAIHPRAAAVRLSRLQKNALYDSMRHVLRKAIDCRGSTISDYVDASGQPGTFQLHHAVYAREAKPCRRCGTPIKRVVLAGRGTHFCTMCQKR